MTRLAEYRDRRELIVNLVLRDLRSRYKRSTLGWGWSLLNPLATIAIYWMVFGQLLKVVPPIGDPSGLRSFVMFMVCGLMPFRFLSDGMSMGTDALLANANLIKKVYFPRELLVMSTVGALLVSFLIELGVLSALLLVVGNMVILWIPVALAVVALTTCFVLGLGFVLAPLNVYLRDVKHLVAIALQVLFYSAPIVYPVTLVPRHSDVLGMNLPLRAIYELNPLVTMVSLFRNVFYDLRFPPIGDLAYFSVWAIGMLVVGHWVFGRLDRRIAEEV